MEQYIKKSALVAEMKRLENDEFLCDSYDEATGFQSALRMVQEFIDTLEVKEINNVWHDTRRTIPEDGSEQIICIKEDGLAVSTVGKIVNGTIKWAYLGDLLDINSFNVDVKELDLEKEAENFVQTEEFVKNESPVLAIAKYFFELGLSVQLPVFIYKPSPQNLASELGLKAQKGGKV